MLRWNDGLRVGKDWNGWLFSGFRAKMKNEKNNRTTEEEEEE